MDERKDKPPLEGALFVDESEPEEIDFDSDQDEDEGDFDVEDGKAEDAADFLEGLLERMNLDTEVDIRTNGKRIVLDVQGPDAGRAIGKKGQTLDALQFLVNKVVNRPPTQRRHVIVDSGDYRERHDDGLVSLARREAKRALQLGKVITLQPMSPRDRRVVHLSLAKFKDVVTRSDGEGRGRRIQIIPSRESARRS